MQPRASTELGRVQARVPEERAHLLKEHRVAEQPAVALQSRQMFWPVIGARDPARALSYPSAASQSGRIPSSSRVLMTRRGVPRSRQATADNRMTASVWGDLSSTAREKLARGASS